MTGPLGHDLAREPAVSGVRCWESGVELDLTPRRSLLYFDGHFPEFAILPGVVQIDWAVRFARRHLNFGRAAARTIQVKFRKPIRPDTPLTLSLSLTASGRRLTFIYRDAQGVCSSGQLGF
jgi:3-hydroxymyristoyl/3-hydroxydecanoyl-(acyl carrier protein) dehydratase